MIVTTMICIVGPWPARAQDGSTPAPAYYVADFELSDGEAIKPYSADVESTFKPFGGRFIVKRQANVTNLADRQITCVFRCT